MMQRVLKAASLAILLTAIAMPRSLFGSGDGRDEAQLLTNIRQLIFEGKRSGEGYFSPDGQALIFQSEREPGNPFFQIYILDLKTGDSHLVSPGIGKTTCAFFQPGTGRVLFASTHLDLNSEQKQRAEIEFRASGKKRRYSWDYDEFMDIFSATRQGTDLKRLTDSKGYDAEASYSPDGGKIAFTSIRDAYKSKLSAEDSKRIEIDPAYFAEIYIMDADGSNQTRLTDWPGYDGGPFFTPDGQRIVWRHFEENGMRADIYTMALDGSDVRRLTDFEAMSWAPYFHPSGRYVIFASNKLGFSNFELYLVDAAGKHQPVRVTFTDGFDGLPVFSPDGQKLCWTSNRTSDKTSQLFLANWDHERALAALESSPSRTPEATPLNSLASAQPIVVDDKRDKSGEDGLSSAISHSDLKAMVDFLASDQLEGRMTGSDGIRLAREYIIARFKEVGVLPFGDEGSYLQKFEFTAGMEVKSEQSHLEMTNTDGRVQEFKLEEDFRPLAFSEDGEFEGEVVFAGYGLKVPGPLGEGYDSYQGLDVENKVALVLRYVPEEVEMERRQVLNRYSGLRYKAMMAREAGAKAILFVTGPNSPKAGELIPLSFDASGASSGIIAASVTDNVAKALFTGSGKDLTALQSTLDVENPHAEGGFPLNVTLKISAGVKRVKKPGYNVIGLLPAAAKESVDEYVLLGAHYDHIGYGEIGSLARKGEEGEIHNGADDNASGTAAVLEIMAALGEDRDKNAERFKRGVIIALWSGEELGLIGSSYFGDHPITPLDKMVAYLNFDMVGRLKDNSLVLQGLGSSGIWTKLIEKRNVAAGFRLTLQDDPYLPTDATSFYTRGVPVLSFFTGSHDDYNRPTDDPETLNYEGLERISAFGKSLVLDLVETSERPDYVKVERSQSEGGGRETLRAYLGTIPDYVEEGTAGVKLSGVRAGGPADKAGLKGGDVIVEFAGQKITNIYDYTYALDAVKIGEPVKIVVLREGKEKTFHVVPEARK